MPRPKNPDATDHYVYAFHANEYPFYVGHGHLGRLSDRPVFVDRLVRLHPDYSYKKWTLHGRVICELWKSKVEVYFDQITEGQTKAEARTQEKQLVGQLLSQGYLLANDDWNPQVQPFGSIAAAILTNKMDWSFLRGFRPINRHLRPR